MDKEKNKTHLFVDNYGELLSQVNGYELVSYEDDGGYQGYYCVVLTDGERLFYYIDSYGSCSGCDWLEDNGSWYKTGDELEKQKGDKYYAVEYKKALEYCGEIKPKFIVPKNSPLEVIWRDEFTNLTRKYTKFNY